MGNIDGQIRRIRVERKGGRNRLAVVRSVLFSRNGRLETVFKKRKEMATERTFSS